MIIDKRSYPISSLAKIRILTIIADKNSISFNLGNVRYVHLRTPRSNSTKLVHFLAFPWSSCVKIYQIEL